MRIFAPTTVRGFWRDRAPVILGDHTDELVPAASVVEVFTYTVPADRVAVIESAYFVLTVSVALAGIDLFRGFFSIYDTVPNEIARMQYTLQNSEGVGVYQPIFNGSWQLNAGYRFACSAQTSVAFVSGRIEASFSGVEYEL